MGPESVTLASVPTTAKPTCVTEVAWVATVMIGAVAVLLLVQSAREDVKALDGLISTRLDAHRKSIEARLDTLVKSTNKRLDVLESYLGVNPANADAARARLRAGIESLRSNIDLDTKWIASSVGSKEL